MTFVSPIIGFEEAKYMLVICSAFVNYLKAKHANRRFTKGEGSGDGRGPLRKVRSRINVV